VISKTIRGLAQMSPYSIFSLILHRGTVDCSEGTVHTVASQPQGDLAIHTDNFASLTISPVSESIALTTSINRIQELVPAGIYIHIIYWPY
jgi:hypothetical protein